MISASKLFTSGRAGQMRQQFLFCLVFSTVGVHSNGTFEVFCFCLFSSLCVLWDQNETRKMVGYLWVFFLLLRRNLVLFVFSRSNCKFWAAQNALTSNRFQNNPIIIMWFSLAWKNIDTKRIYQWIIFWGEIMLYNYKIIFCSLNKCLDIDLNILRT